MRVDEGKFVVSLEIKAIRSETKDRSELVAIVIDAINNMAEITVVDVEEVEVKS